MEIHVRAEVHLHFHGDPSLPLDKFDCVLQQIARLSQKVSDMAATLDQVLAKVTQEATDIDSLLALFTGLKQQLADALSGANLPPAVQAKVDAIFDNASASAQKVADALAANVPPTP